MKVRIFMALVRYKIISKSQITESYQFISNPFIIGKHTCLSVADAYKAQIEQQYHLIKEIKLLKGHISKQHEAALDYIERNGIDIASKNLYNAIEKYYIKDDNFKADYNNAVRCLKNFNDPSKHKNMDKCLNSSLLNCCSLDMMAHIANNYNLRCEILTYVDLPESSFNLDLTEDCHIENYLKSKHITRGYLFTSSKDQNYWFFLSYEYNELCFDKENNSAACKLQHWQSPHLHMLSYRNTNSMSTLDLKQTFRNGRIPHKTHIKFQRIEQIYYPLLVNQIESFIVRS